MAFRTVRLGSTTTMCMRILPDGSVMGLTDFGGQFVYDAPSPVSRLRKTPGPSRMRATDPRDTSKLMILLLLLNPKRAIGHAA